MWFIFVFFFDYLLILFALLFQDSLACPKDIHANKASFYPQNHRATRTDHRLDTADTLPNLLQVDILWKLQAGGVTLPPHWYARNIWTMNTTYHEITTNFPSQRWAE